MPNSNKLSLDWTKVEQVCSIQANLQQEVPALLKAQSALFEKTGLGAEFTDWVNFIQKDANDVINKQKELVQKIKEISNAVVVIGIGGSLLGTKAVYEALTHSFAPLLSKKEKGNPLLFWAGHHVAQDELAELCEALDRYSPTLIVISKSGGTTEPALAFRVLKNYLQERFGAQESNQRIFAITDPSSGTLLSIAKENHYPYYTVPKGIGGRYSIFTAVGLFPLALAGIDVEEFVHGAQAALANAIAGTSDPLKNNLALCYAGIRNVLYKKGYKIESLCSWTPKARSIAEWWKQLFGESDGKGNTGIFPASANFTTDLHSLGQYFQEGERHMFATHLQFSLEKSASSQHEKIVIPASELKDGFDFLTNKELSSVQREAQAGTYLAHSEGKIPTLVWEIPQLNAYWLGHWMFTNMLACGIGGYARGINPFDQPGVENYKTNMFALLGKPGFEQKAQEIRAQIGSSVPLKCEAK